LQSLLRGCYSTWYYLTVSKKLKTNTQESYSLQWLAAIRVLIFWDVTRRLAAIRVLIFWDVTRRLAAIRVLVFWDVTRRLAAIRVLIFWNVTRRLAAIRVLIFRDVTRRLAPIRFLIFWNLARRLAAIRVLIFWDVTRRLAAIRVLFFWNVTQRLAAIRVLLLWDVTLCRRVGDFRCFEVSCRLHPQGSAVNGGDTTRWKVGSIYPASQRHNQETRNFINSAVTTWIPIQIRLIDLRCHPTSYDTVQSEKWAPTSCSTRKSFWQLSCQCRRQVILKH
jgi:hypothetical protein